MLSQVVSLITQRLARPLPGSTAHQLMMPRLSSGGGIRFRSDAPARKGAVLLLLYEKDGKVHFPLIQRPQYNGVHSGQVALPGGTEESGDPDLHHTALRETHEEIGVPPQHIRVIGNLSEFFVAASNHLVLPVIGYTTELPVFVPDQYEVQEVIEAPLNALLDERQQKEKEIVTSLGHRLHSPYYDLENRVVWGATAMILSEFVQLIRNP